jgi:tRNA modification GTPase
MNKVDTISVGASVNAAANVSRETFLVHNISAKTGAGLARLTADLEAVVQERFGLRADIGLTRARHAACARTCLEAAVRARTNLDLAPELAGEDLRRALHAIKELAGEADIEMVLDRIFTRFCIGK